MSIEFEGEQTPHAIMERFLAEALPKVLEFSPNLILWSVRLDSAMGDPLGGLGSATPMSLGVTSGIVLLVAFAWACRKIQSFRPVTIVSA